MSNRNYQIEPPPNDKGKEPLFRVVYVIDVNAPNALKAAKLVHEIMAAHDSMPPVLDVIDYKGNVSKIDLSTKDENANRRQTKTIKEKCPDSPPLEVEVTILSENGNIWIQPKGYGEKCTMDGEGWPIGIEIWQGRLRVIIFDNITSEDPKIIDLENARESNR